MMMFQEAKMSVCSGPLVLPHCAAGARAKVDRVWARCGAGARRGVGVICWGCGVWHRYHIFFPLRTRTHRLLVLQVVPTLSHPAHPGPAQLEQHRVDGQLTQLISSECL